MSTGNKKLIKVSPAITPGSKKLSWDLGPGAIIPATQDPTKERRTEGWANPCTQKQPIYERSISLRENLLFASAVNKQSDLQDYLPLTG
ncbi:hypothetical protein RRG08_020255 [Elysia crispata]|uniref:Uncharacterized protein n=1 Tax=Elysia crispata TaxID=231223 RepID=A0AAE1B2K8_9GAST|nr:hypothetical protein RRG08_020255 [Elysia crispata]